MNEFRGAKEERHTDFQQVRTSLYAMAAGNWKISLVDLGTIQPGATREDTLFAVKEVVQAVIQKKAFPLVIGGSQTLLLPMYEALCAWDKPLNYTAIDAQIPLQAEEVTLLEDQNVFNHILTDPSELLFQFTNVGYQSFYTSYQIIDMLEAMDFESYRLGEVVQSIKETEPIFRSTDLASVNINAIQSQIGKDRTSALPNGFNTREICALMKMVGLSPQLKTLGIFHYFEDGNTALLSELLAQMLWYFIDSRNVSVLMKQTEHQYKKYTVLIDEKELVFYEDEVVHKWWIALDIENDSPRLVPCSEGDYEKAKNNEIPERYWKNIKRFL